MPGARDGTARTQAIDLATGEPQLLQHIFIVLADFWSASCRHLRNAVHFQRITHRKLQVLAGPLQRHDDVVLPQLWIVGGLSGPAIRPIAVRMVYECRRAVKIPVIGMGGIASARDVLEFIIAGATAVQVGTANFVDPFIWPKLLDGINDYMRRHNVARIADLIGTIDATAREKQWISS